jgi:hypothetical protein
MSVRDLYALGVNGGALLGQRAAALAVLKIRNESGKKRTFPALGGSVTRRRFTEPARAAMGFIGRGAAAGMGACPENHPAKRRRSRSAWHLGG